MQSKYVDDEICKSIEERLEEPYRGCWRFSYRNGLRVSDVCNLRFGDIDVDGYLHYTARKTGKRCRIKLDFEDIDKYVRYRGRSTDAIFPSPRNAGRCVTRQAVWQHIKRACDELGIDKHGVSPHSGRKHFAVSEFERGGFGAAMSALNHSSPGTTAVYVFSKDPFADIREELTVLSDTVSGIIALLDRICDDLGYSDCRYRPVDT